MEIAQQQGQLDVAKAAASNLFAIDAVAAGLDHAITAGLPSDAMGGACSRHSALGSKPGPGSNLVELERSPACAVCVDRGARKGISL